MTQPIDKSDTAKVAALYVDRRGPYWNRPDVDAWDLERDARDYAGPWPVVAHPPCGRWCRMAKLVQSKGGRRVGEDDGCFASALSSVRKWGGVLEHPALTLAWPAFGLPRPTRGGWTRDMSGGWSCCIDQAAYGHVAPKATWLYYMGRAPDALAWNKGAPTMVINRARDKSGKPEMPKSQRHITPPAFAELLISIARSSRPAQERAA